MKGPLFSATLFALSLVACEACGGARKEIAAPAETGPAPSRPSPQSDCVNLNMATVEELMRLPAIGRAMAQRIVEHRERNGPFRRPEEIIIIEGFGERKYRSLAPLICVK